MSNTPFKDPQARPTDRAIFSIIGEHEIVWKQTFEYLHQKSEHINEMWRYYNDGKCWLMRVMMKKKTVSWVSVLDDTFRIAFYIAERFEPQIMESALSEELKHQYSVAKPFNKSRAIYIDVAKSDDIEEIKKLIDLKFLTL